MGIPNVSWTRSSDYFSSSARPVLTVDAGDRFSLETRSVLTGRSRIPDRYDDLVIPITGPVMIRGAREGQVLKVELLKVDLANEGILFAVPGKGAFGDQLQRFVSRRVSIQDGRCILWDGVEIPLSPMVGKLGVGVPVDAPRSNTVGRHGGNMDNNALAPGVIAYFPILADGAYLYAGDLHAAQGDGESALSAVEVEGRVELRCTIIDLPQLRRPLLASSDWTMATADGATLDEAVQTVLTDLVDLLQALNNWTFEDAILFSGDAARL